MKFLKNILAFFATLILVPGLLFTAFFGSFAGSMNEEVLVKIINRADFSSLIEEGLEENYPGLPEELKVSIKSEINRTVKNKSTLLISSLFRFFRGESDTIEPLDLKSFKENIKKELLEYTQKSVSPGAWEQNKAVIVKKFEENWRQMAAQIPDSIDLIGEIKKAEQWPQVLEARGAFISLENLQTVLVVLFIFCALIVVWSKDSLKEGLKGAGYRFLIPATLIVLTAFTPQNLFDPVKEAVSGSFREIPFLSEDSEGSLGIFINQFFSLLKIYGFVYMGAAAVLLIPGNLMKSKEEKEAETTEY